jgi:ABC-type transport system involved in cytochrome c biogenesis permease component
MEIEKGDNMKLTNKQYDTLKYIALIALPALQVFWLSIGKIWNINYTVEIGATIGAVALLLGTLLGVSTSNYRADKEQDNFNKDAEEMLEVAEDEDTEDTAEE